VLPVLPEAEMDTGQVTTPAIGLVESLARSKLSTVAARHQMFDFFVNKTAINTYALNEVREALSPYVEVQGLQLLHIGLPAEMEEAMMTTAITRLGKTRAERYKEAMSVTFRALSLVARYNFTATVNRAIGAAHAASQLGLANAAITSRTVRAEMDAFANVSSALAAKPLEVVQYSWFDQVVGSRHVPMAQLMAGAAATDAFAARFTPLPDMASRAQRQRRQHNRAS